MVKTLFKLLMCDQGDNPIKVWGSLWGMGDFADLVDFAILILSIVVNQGATERSFSDLKIKKTQHWNRLKLPQLEKMSKVRIPNCMRQN